MTRLQKIQSQGVAPAMPPPGMAAYLADYLFDAGPVTHNAMGSAPLGWQDLQAWQRSTGIELQAWEARALRRLSHTYLGASQAALAPDCPPPWSAQPTPERRAHISHSLRNIFKSMKVH